jgi:hypothetical protein
MKPSRSNLALFCASLFAAVAAADARPATPTLASAPIIRVETGHHQAFINRLIMLDEERLLTVSDDQTARSWDKSGRPLAVVRGRVGPRDEGALYAAAMSSRYVALGGRAGAAEGAPYVRLLDRTTLEPAGLLASLPDVVTALAFSSDGQRLAVGFAKSGVRIYQLGKGSPLAELPAGSEGANDLLFLSDGSLVVSSGRIDLYDPRFANARSLALPEGFSPWGLAISRDGKRLAIGSRQGPRAAIVDIAGGPARFCGIGATAGSAPVVSWGDDNRLLIGGRDDQGGRLALCGADGASLYSAATGPAPVTAVSAGFQQLHFADAEGAWGSLEKRKAQFLSQPFKLRFRTSGPPALSVSRDGRQVTLINDGRPFAQLDLGARRASRATVIAAPAIPGTPAADVRDLEPGERVFAHTPAPGGGTFVGTSYYLRRVEGSGRTAWKAPVAAPVWGVAVAEQAHMVIAALGDGTLGWHDLRTGVIRLNAYVSPQLDWAAWTPDGFFDRSGSGATLIGHAIDRGPRDGSLFVPLEQTARRYFRSDLIQAALGGAPGDNQMLARAHASVGAAGTRLTASSPPEVSIVSVCGVERMTDRAIACFEGAALAGGLRAAQLVSYEKIDVTIGISGRDGRAGATRIKVAGISATPIGEKTITDGATERRRFRLQLPPGDPDVQISVATSDGAAASRTASIHIADVPEPSVARVARLHMLAIGISDYQLSSFDLGDDIASNDAKAVAATLASTRNLAYSGANSTILTDNAATAAAIRGAMDELAAKASLGDLVIIFIAGHGEQVDGDYVFAPYEIGFASRGAAETRLRSGQAFSDQVMHDMFRKEGIGQEDLGNFLGRLRARRVVVVLDTCFGGSFSTLNSGQRDSITSSIGERFAESSGRYVIASSRGLALDNAAKGASNSIFTSSVLKGVNGEADRDRDQIVTLAELGDYVRREVPASAARMRVEQTPVISFFGDPYFPLYKLNDGANR